MKTNIILDGNISKTYCHDIVISRQFISIKYLSSYLSCLVFDQNISTFQFVRKPQNGQEVKCRMTYLKLFGVSLSTDFQTAIKFQHVPHQTKFELDNKKRMPLLVYTINVLLDYHLMYLYSECLTNARISLYFLMRHFMAC